MCLPANEQTVLYLLSVADTMLKAVDMLVKMRQETPPPNTQLSGGGPLSNKTTEAEPRSQASLPLCQFPPAAIPSGVDETGHPTIEDIAPAQDEDEEREWITCWECDGDGIEGVNGETCWRCRGTGEVLEP